MKLKEIEFKLMFKTLLVIILIFVALFVIVPSFSFLYDKAFKEPFEERNPWSKYVDENNYTKSRDWFIENGEFKLNKKYIDHVFCWMLPIDSDLKYVYEERSERYFKKLLASQKLSTEKEKEFLIYAGAVPLKLKQMYDSLDDQDQKQGINAYCYDLL